MTQQPDHSISNRNEPVGATAVLIGRAGSKGLPGKNSRMLAGKPMVAHSIEHALQATHVNRVLVSSDCPNLLAAAGAYSDVEIVKRPPELAADTTTVDDAVRHAVSGDAASVVVILYVNVPIRPADVIDRAIEKLLDTGADSVQSYQAVGKYHPYWMNRLDDDGRVVAYEANTVYRRQDLPPLYVPDGGVIVVRRDSLFTVVPGEPHAFLGRDRRGIVNPSMSVIDIDTELDLRVAEAVLLQSGIREPNHVT
ncbi:MAG: acylneuraminate cytidylyltransferase family protein [Planctomycetes bacterium]|nr:acylneuraminate cytidylyltransferase family protein [Planctomycetota bacterium]NOG53353.1 acylneuraminate cytidylyltransferase family protein [Planctomycetota bacterium]